MAERLLRHHAGERFEVEKLNPTAVDVMREVGIDISGLHSKDVAEFHPVSAKGSPTERMRVLGRDEIEGHVLDFIVREA